MKTITDSDIGIRMNAYLQIYIHNFTYKFKIKSHYKIYELFTLCAEGWNRLTKDF